jgi:sugar lactone lactonase YvrE
MQIVRATCLAFVIVTPGLAAAQRGDILIDGKSVHPESVTSTQAGDVITGSIQGTIYRAAPNASVARAWIQPSPENKLGSVFGVLAHDASGTLWVCSVPNPFGPPVPGATNALVAFELVTGAFRARYDFPAGRAACNDMSVAFDGSVFVADTQGARILKLPKGGSRLEVFAEDERLRGVDGIAFAADRRLYVNNVTTGAMLRVEMGGHGGYAGLTPLAVSLELSGPDALRLIEGNRFVQAEGTGGRITEVTIVGDEARVRVLRDGLDGSPGVTPAGDVVYAVEGKIRYMFDSKLRGQDPGPFKVIAIPLAP